MATLPKKQSFFRSPVTLFFVACATIFVLFQVFDVYSKRQYTKGLLSETESYYERLSQTKNNLEEQKALLEDVRGKEAFLREKNGLLLEGEEVYVIVAVPNSLPEDTPKQESWFQKLLPLY